MVKSEIQRNEQGHRLNKNGTVDQRSVKAIENLKKSSVYQNIMKAKEGVAEAKKVQPVKVEEESEDEESEDDEPEYEIERIEDKKKEKEIEKETVLAEVEEKINTKLSFVQEKNEIEERTKKWLEEHREASKKEKEEMKRLADEEIKTLKEENRKLKGLNHYNDHLTRISHLARNVSIKF